MRIRILAVLRVNVGIQALFSTENGSGNALWGGDDVPGIGEEYDAEFDIDSAINFAQNASTNNEHECGVSSDGSSMSFKGMIESQDDDGVSYLRVFRDCLLMIESDESGIVGRWLKLNIPAGLVKITPIGG